MYFTNTFMNEQAIKTHTYDDSILLLHSQDVHKIRNRIKFAVIILFTFFESHSDIFGINGEKDHEIQQNLS